MFRKGPFPVGLRVLPLLFSSSLFAQFTFSPSTVLLKNQVLNSLSYDSIHITNTSGTKLHLNWSLISYDTVGGSYFDFCASGNCFLWVPDTGSFPEIDTGQFGWAGMHFWTGPIPGISETKIFIYEEGNPGGGDTLTYILNASPAGIAGVEAGRTAIIPFPSPSSGRFSLYNVPGRLVNLRLRDGMGRTILLQTSSEVDLTGFAPGIYFAEIISDQGMYYSKIMLR